MAKENENDSKNSRALLVLKKLLYGFGIIILAALITASILTSVGFLGFFSIIAMAGGILSAIVTVGLAIKAYRITNPYEGPISNTLKEELLSVHVSDNKAEKSIMYKAAFISLGMTMLCFIFPPIGVAYFAVGMTYGVGNIIKYFGDKFFHFDTVTQPASQMIPTTSPTVIATSLQDTSTVRAKTAPIAAKGAPVTAKTSHVDQLSASNAAKADPISPSENRDNYVQHGL